MEMKSLSAALHPCSEGDSVALPHAGLLTVQAGLRASPPHHYSYRVVPLL